MVLPLIIMLLGSFFDFLMKNQHELYAIFLSSKNRRNGLHGKKYVHDFLAIFYITFFLTFWKSLRKNNRVFFSGNDHYVKSVFDDKNDVFYMVKLMFFWKNTVLLPWPLRCVFCVKKWDFFAWWFFDDFWSFFIFFVKNQLFFHFFHFFNLDFYKSHGNKA